MSEREREERESERERARSRERASLIHHSFKPFAYVYQAKFFSFQSRKHLWRRLNSVACNSG